MKKKVLPTQKELHKQFSYDEKAGLLIRKIASPSNQRFVGKPIGTVTKNGRRLAKVNGEQYLTARLVYMYHTGIDPCENDIDHKDEDKSNDRIENLRLGTHRQNMFNRGKNANNTSGHKNVFWYPAYNKWLVRVAGKHIGYFVEKADAILASIEAGREFGGEFAK